MSEKEIAPCVRCGKPTIYREHPVNPQLSMPICIPCLSAWKESIGQEPEPVAQEIKSFSSRFEFTSPIAVQESKTGKTIISGTLISEGISGNGNLYTIDVLETLDNLKDIPIYVGTGANNKHTKASGIVGKILRTAFDKIKRRVTFIAEIFNETVAKSVKTGWGISIGGQGKGEYVLDSLGKLITRVKRLALYHVQLLMPTTKRGMDSAQVENVEIQESMIFRDMPKLTSIQIKVIVSALIAKGEIKL